MPGQYGEQRILTEKHFPNCAWGKRLMDFQGEKGMLWSNIFVKPFILYVSFPGESYVIKL